LAWTGDNAVLVSFLFVHIGLTNAGIPNDEVLPFEQRTGRKGKRRSSAKVPEGRYQAVSSGKEKANVECSTADVLQRDHVWNQDGISHSGKFI